MSAARMVGSVFSSSRPPSEILPTPTANLGSSGPDYARRGRDGSGGDGLQNIHEMIPPVAMLPTPTVGNVLGGNKTRSGARGDEMLLPGIVETFLPTPRASRGASSTEIAYGLGGERSDAGRPQGEVLLPTPVVKDADNARRRTDDGLPASAGSNPGTTLTDAVSLLPTPRMTDGPKGAAGAHVRSAERLEEGRATLPEAVQLLPTPLVSDRQAPHTRETDRDFPPQLRAIGQMLPSVELLPTPVASDSHNSPEVHLRKKPGRKVVTSLQIIADHDLISRGGDPTAAADETILDDTADGTVVAWGKYRPAILRAQQITGRLAPAPTKGDGRAGKHRLSSRFVEWLMMLPEGRVTGHGLSRNAELARLGNGVVPIQAAVATASGISRLAAMKRGDL